MGDCGVGGDGVVWRGGDIIVSVWGDRVIGKTDMTYRQRLVWSLVCDGLSDKQIASVLGVSISRVRQYLFLISVCLGLEGVNRALIVRAGCAPGMVDMAEVRAGQTREFVVH